MSKDRGVFRMIWNNFKSSFTPVQFRGNFMGKDRFGNSYYEIPKEKQRKPGRANRWFVPQQKDDFMKEMPAEWEAWLRGRRNYPPTEQELAKNFEISEMKKKGAAEIEIGEPTGIPKPIKEGTQAFPKYNEFEQFPGKKPSNGS